MKLKEPIAKLKKSEQTMSGRYAIKLTGKNTKKRVTKCASKKCAKVKQLKLF